MTPEKVEKPWGYYTDIFRSKEAVFKTIVVFVGQELSYLTLLSTGGAST